MPPSTYNKPVFAGLLTSPPSALQDYNISSIDGSLITTGTISPARLGSGTPGSTTFLRGDGVWAEPPGASASGPLVNVKDHGAVGDGSTDDTAAIQAAINAAQSSTGGFSGIFFPRGRYKVSDTLNVGSVRGIRIVGSGKRQSVDGLVFVGSELVWADTAPTDRPVFSLNGTSGFAIKDLSFVGNSADSPRAQRGIRLKTIAGTGAGSGLIENVSILRFVEAVSIGSDGADENGDNMTYLRVEIIRCTKGLVLEQTQNVNHHMVDCAFTFVDDAVHVRKGGNVLLVGAVCYDVQRVFYLDDQGSGIGTNNGYFGVHHAFLDGTTYRTKLVEMSAATSGCHIEIRDVKANSGQPTTGARVVLRQYSTCRVSGCTNISKGGPIFDLYSGTGYSSIIVENTAIKSPYSSAVGTLSGGNTSYRIVNCYDEDTNNKIADVGVMIPWGSLTGTLSNQSDLQTALNGKANTSHTHATSDITGEFGTSSIANGAITPAKCDGTSMGAWTVVTKSSDQSVQSTTTLQNDNELLFPMSANKTYQFELLAFTSTPTNADFKFGFTGPASPTKVSVNHLYKADGFSGNSSKTAYETTGVAGLHGSVTEGLLSICGRIANGNNAGNFQLTWCQNTSNAGNTSVLKGSFIRWRQID